MSTFQSAGTRQKYPELVQVQTVEKWLPSHACCMQGHFNVLELLFKYPYPPHIMQKYVDRTGNYDYELPFDINSKDVSGNEMDFLFEMKIFNVFFLNFSFRTNGSVHGHLYRKSEDGRVAVEVPGQRQI